jgi:hypothetical protein
MEQRMHRGKLLVTALAVVALSACGQAQAVVTAELEVEDPEAGVVNRPLGGMEVRLYPFDRDVVFDSLAAAASAPEPQIPEDLLTAQQELADAQTEWTSAEAEWQALRDQLQQINDELQGLNRGETRYVQLYNQFQDLERQVGGAERATERAFERFEEIQQATIQRVDSIRILRQNWEDDAFADIGAVFDARIVEAGRDILYDTTSADGVATFDGTNGMEAGQWWVYARHELPFDELYWNVPIQVEGSEPAQVHLDRSNALRRPKL